jgi:hypothetical protein
MGEGGPALSRATASLQTHCSNDKDPVEQERAGTGFPGPMSHALPLFLLLSGADRDFI